MIFIYIYTLSNHVWSLFQFLLKQYKNQQIEYSDNPPSIHHSKVNVGVRHVFSVEIEDFKREFIKSAHTPPGNKPEFCLFDDVAILEKDTAFCYTCNREHETALDVDVYFVGPSCKNISYENPRAKEFASCYTSGDGCSGATYQLGFRHAVRVTCPAVAFFENTKGVADRVKDVNGQKQRPRIEVHWLQTIDSFNWFWGNNR